MAHSRPVLRGTVVVSCLCHPLPFILALRRNSASTKDASAPVAPPFISSRRPPSRRWAARRGRDAGRNHKSKGAELLDAELRRLQLLLVRRVRCLLRTAAGATGRAAPSRTAAP